MNKKLRLIAIFIAAILFVSCNTSTKENKDLHNDTIVHSVKHKDCKDVHWSHHKGDTGPENWKNLCDGFSDCGGKVQSPINIITKDISVREKLLAPEFKYEKSSIDILNNGHTIQFNISGENTVKLDGKEYKLLQFHFHAPSENRIDGKQFPIEVHFVHQYSDSDFAVIAIMYVEGKENELLKNYLEFFPEHKGEYKSEKMLDLASLLPQNRSFYFYKGSLTTPPCSEVVNWYVLKTPLTASKDQIEQISKILDNNFRPVQNLNGRKVVEYSEK